MLFHRMLKILMTVTRPTARNLSAKCDLHSGISVKACSDLSTRRSDNLLLPWPQGRIIQDAAVRSFFVSSVAKAKRKCNKPVVQKVDLREVSEYFEVEKIVSQMKMPVEIMKNKFVKNLSLRTNIGSIEQLPVTFEGKEYTLEDLALISRKPKIIVIDVSTFPQALSNILTALSASGMNLNPQQDGTTLFIPIQKVTKEHREVLSKNAKVLYVECYNSIRSVENKCNRIMKKKPSMSIDVIERMQNHLRGLGDQYVKEATDILEAKKKELSGLE